MGGGRGGQPGWGARCTPARTMTRPAPRAPGARCAPPPGRADPPSYTPVNGRRGPGEKPVFGWAGPRAPAILTAMNRQGVRRLIVIQGFPLPFPEDPRNLGRPVMAAMLRLWNRHLIADSHQMAEVLRESELDWTLIRMPLLAAGPAAGGYQVGHLALGPWSRVTAGQVADFPLACLATGGFAREAPMIADAGRWSRKPSAGATGRQLTAGGEPSSLASEPADQAGGARS